MPGYEKEILKSGKNIYQYLRNLDLDGIELLVYDNKLKINQYKEITIGVHLKYWPMWMSLYENNRKELLKYYSNDDMINTYGAVDYDGWLNCIRENLKHSLKVNPEYLVWHVAECNLEECFSFSFKYSDLDVIKATADIFNSVCDVISSNVTVLFENLWWPGLKLNNKDVVETFFLLLKHKNVGIMLDTGHLMNTNYNLKNQKDAVSYICKTVESLEAYKNYITGIHLSSSLSGNYIKNLNIKYDKNMTLGDIYKHITNIDQHKPFIDGSVKDIIRLVSPKYLVHELAYKDFCDLEKNLLIQINALK